MICVYGYFGIISDVLCEEVIQVDFVVGGQCYFDVFVVFDDKCQKFGFIGFVIEWIQLLFDDVNVVVIVFGDLLFFGVVCWI